MQFNTKRGLVDIPNDEILAAARTLGLSAVPAPDQQGHCERSRPATGSAFVRERRYLVVKLEDARRYLTSSELHIMEHLGAKIALSRYQDGKPDLQCVCVESDWPEYEPTWQAIEERMAKQNDAHQPTRRTDAR